jgi:SAM-dependent methyltransferase
MAQKTDSVDTSPGGGREHYLSVQKELEFWFQSTAGRELLASQRQVIAPLISRVFGFHQAEICVSHRVPVGNASNLGHRFHVVPFAEQDMPTNTVVSSSTELALDHDSADLVILHHALDFSEDPHQTLREASRILNPSGQMVLIGFNPMSLWGLYRLIQRRKQGVWGNRFIGGGRVEDWLNLLGFKVERLRYHFYAPPLNNLSLIKRFSWIDNTINSKVPLGAYYVIVAKKQQYARIGLSQRWRQKSKVVGLPVANRMKRNDDEIPR